MVELVLQIEHGTFRPLDILKHALRHRPAEQAEKPHAGEEIIQYRGDREDPVDIAAVELHELDKLTPKAVEAGNQNDQCKPRCGPQTPPILPARGR